MFSGRQRQRALWVLTCVSAPSESCRHAPTAPCHLRTWLCRESLPGEVQKGRLLILKAATCCPNLALSMLHSAPFSSKGGQFFQGAEFVAFLWRKRLIFHLPQYFLTRLQTVAGFLYLPQRQSARSGFQLQGGSSEFFWIPLAPHIPPAGLFF